MGWLTSIATAQNGNGNSNSNAGGVNWKLSGNQATTTDFIGTTNTNSLVLKCNNIKALEISADTSARFMGDVVLEKLRPVTPLPPNERELVTVDNNGRLTSLSRNGLVSSLYDPQIQCPIDLNELFVPIWSAKGLTPTLGALYTGVSCPARVGIGTDNPTASLDVRGNGFFTQTLQVNQALQVSTNATKFVVGNAGGHDLGYGTSYIGFNARRIGDATHLWQTSSDGAHNGGAVIYGDIFGSIIFSTLPNTGITDQTTISDATVAQNTRLFIHNNGNVGIGTTAVTGAKLSVEGIIRARRVNVDAASIVWSDFVFEPNYNLMSLIQLEKFIVKNKHLPGVPSATEVKENGIDLAQMDAILLQKIEELTLYIIELKKEITKLKEEQKKQ